MKIWDIDKNIDLLHREYMQTKDNHAIELIDSLTELYKAVFGTEKTIARFIYDLVKSNGEIKGTSIVNMFFEDLLKAINLKQKFNVANYLLVTGEVPNRPIKVNFPTADTKSLTIADEIVTLIRVLGFEDTILVLKVIVNNLGR